MEIRLPLMVDLEKGGVLGYLGGPRHHGGLCQWKRETPERK